MENQPFVQDNSSQSFVQHLQDELNQTKDEIKEANTKIEHFVSEYGLEKYNMTKKEACLKRMSPNIYKEVFGV